MIRRNDRLRAEAPVSLSIIIVAVEVIRQQACVDPDLRSDVLSPRGEGERYAAAEHSEKRQWICHLTCGFSCELLSKGLSGNSFSAGEIFGECRNCKHCITMSQKKLSTDFIRRSRPGSARHFPPRRPRKSKPGLLFARDGILWSPRPQARERRWPRSWLRSTR